MIVSSFSDLTVQEIRGAKLEYVITKQDVEKHKSISLVPVPIFLIQPGQENIYAN